MDKIKLFLDEDVHASLSTILKKRGVDVVHAQEVDRKGRSDSDQLEYASQQERCLISFNVKDYVLLHNQYVQERKGHWGIILSKQLSMGETLRKVLMVLQSNSKNSMKNRILFLSKEGK